MVWQKLELEFELNLAVGPLFLSAGLEGLLLPGAAIEVQTATQHTLQWEICHFLTGRRFLIFNLLDICKCSGILWWFFGCIWNTYCVAYLCCTVLVRRPFIETICVMVNIFFMWLGLHYLAHLDMKGLFPLIYSSKLIWNLAELLRPQ